MIRLFCGGISGPCMLQLCLCIPHPKFSHSVSLCPHSYGAQSWDSKSPPTIKRPSGCLFCCLLVTSCSLPIASLALALGWTINCRDEHCRAFPRQIEGSASRNKNSRSGQQCVSMTVVCVHQLLFLYTQTPPPHVLPASDVQSVW